MRISSTFLHPPGAFLEVLVSKSLTYPGCSQSIQDTETSKIEEQVRPKIHHFFFSTYPS